MLYEPDRRDSLLTGIVAHPFAKCDEAVEVVRAAASKVYDKRFSDITLHHNDKVNASDAGSKIVKVRGQNIVVNPSLLFTITGVLN